MQSNNFTKQLLTNKTLASDITKNKMLQQTKEPVSPLLEKNSCHRKNIFSKSTQSTGMKEILMRNCMIFHYFFFCKSFKVNNRLVISASCLGLLEIFNVCFLEIIWVFGIAHFKYGVEIPGPVFALVDPVFPKIRWQFSHSYCPQKVRQYASSP